MKTPYILLLVGIAALAGVILFLHGAPGPENATPKGTAMETPAAELPPAEVRAPEAPTPLLPAQAQESVERSVLTPLHEEDENGNTWMVDLASGQRYGTATPDGKQPGPPIVVKTDVYQQSTRQFSIGLVLAGQAGESYRPVVMRNGQPRSAPKLKIVDEAGNVLVDDSFKYG